MKNQDQELFPRRKRRGWRLFLFLALVILLLLVLGRAADSMQGSERNAQKNALESALSRDITACYALEGAYPPDVAYLEEHYGLVYDHDAFSIGYEVQGENLRPTYTVVEKGGGL